MPCGNEIFFIAHHTFVTRWFCDAMDLPQTSQSLPVLPTASPPLASPCFHRCQLLAWAPHEFPDALDLPAQPFILLPLASGPNSTGDTEIAQGEHVAIVAWMACPFTGIVVTRRDGVDRIPKNEAEVSMAQRTFEQSVHHQLVRHCPALLHRLPRRLRLLMETWAARRRSLETSPPKNAQTFSTGASSSSSSTEMIMAPANVKTKSTTTIATNFAAVAAVVVDVAASVAIRLSGCCCG